MKQCIECNFMSKEDILKCPFDDSLLIDVEYDEKEINKEVVKFEEEILEPEVEDLNNGGIVDNPINMLNDFYVTYFKGIYNYII